MITKGNLEVRDLMARRTITQLRFIADSLDLPSTGTKKDLAVRISKVMGNLVLMKRKRNLLKSLLI